MKIKDLTRNKYANFYDSTNLYYYNDKLNHIECYCYRFEFFFGINAIRIKTLLENIPVFLVETTMADEFISIPGEKCAIHVPKNESFTNNEFFDIDEWVNSKEQIITDDPRERCSSVLKISDILGVYIRNSNSFVPIRIFIWMDKIRDYAINNTKNKNDININASSLFDLVLFHEIGHAVMDVELYNIHPSPYLSYCNDLIYRFVEEAYANAFSLEAILEELKPCQQLFIKTFVSSQEEGYSYGLDIYQHHLYNIEQWMCVKVLFKYDYAFLLRDFWIYKDFSKIEFVQSVGHNGWLAVKNRQNKWSLIDSFSQIRLKGFKEYHSFWSFDVNGLCLVRLNSSEGYLYGYINKKGEEQIPVEYDYLYSYENGITIAKNRGSYGAIDLNNNIIIPFSLPYLDVRGFRNGRASVKNVEGKWGVIDTSGKLIVPCTSDEIIL